MARVLIRGAPRLVSSTRQIEHLQAEADYYHDRIALLRAKLYRWGLGPNARLQELERKLELAEERLRDARSRPGS